MTPYWLVITFLEVLAACILNVVQGYFSVVETQEEGSSDISNRLQINVASYPRRHESSWTLLWEAHILYCADVLS